MGKAVYTQHAQYKAYIERWTRARDCTEGSDAVKAKGVLYLPMLDSHGDVGGNARYSAYVQRALFYNATNRTVDGFAGAVFQKAPSVTVPKEFEDNLKDITLTGTSLDMFGLEQMREILTTGRVGILVDMPTLDPDQKTLDPEAKPYLTSYRAEDIINWKTARINGREVLQLVVLREATEVQDPNDEFVTTDSDQYRVLEMRGGVYTSTIWTKATPQSGLYEPGESVTPERLGKPLTYIPFLFVNALGTTAKVCRPPLIDLVDLNISHYRTSADLEHGRHFTALPQPWIAGGAPGQEAVSIGAGGVWMLDKDGQAGMLEFTGQGLTALVTADTEKRKMMATLGARMLEEQSAQAETATAVTMRHSGEQASLRTLVQVLENGLTRALQMYLWWAGSEETPDDVEAGLELNKDFFAVRMGSEDLKSLVLALQADTISQKTFYYNLVIGEIARPGVTAEEEEKEIEKQKAKKPMPNAAPGMPFPPKNPDGSPAEDESTPPQEIVAEGNPYTVVKRGGRYLVIKSNTGETVPGGDHGSDKKKALAHLAALEANIKDA